MVREALTYLFEIQRACELLKTFTAGKSYSDYAEDAMLRSAVERQFEVVGEAVAGLARTNEPLASRITQFQRIIAFRNVLIHGYATVDDRLVWNVVESDLPTLAAEVADMAAELLEDSE